MSKKIRYAYCTTCKKEIEEPSKKPLTTSQKIMWLIACIATIGIAAIFFPIVQSKKPADYCPTCLTKLEYSDEPFIKPKKKREDMTPREKVLDKAGLEEVSEEEPLKKEPEKKKTTKKKSKKEKEIKLFCEYCGEELDDKYAVCPFCQTPLKL